ncbi:hypothetical protein BGZ95_007907 [Linnemannia exigua]|uniref:Uncharacterized protein n=1 Tax=Linnemannia exigua TaxID=604196 RepID=A0AAD4DF55_9FUNG|nr:hypothetical protein BGZ95_007907 [Linnemannia exigua]
MSDINNTSSNTSANPPRRLSFSEKIAEKFSMKGRRNSGQSQQSKQSQNNHQYGTRESAHDSAFAVEGSIVGAHAIPPFSLEHRYRSTPASTQNRSQGKAQQQGQGQAQAQALAQPQAPVQTHADQQQSSGPSHSGEGHYQHHHTEGQIDPTEGLEERLGGNDHRPLM